MPSSPFFTKQPSSIVGTLGTLRSVNVQASSTVPFTYAWHISGNFSEGPVAGIFDLDLVSLSGVDYTEYNGLSALAAVVKDTFDADTNTLKVRVLDNTCFGPLSSFTFYCVASSQYGTTPSNSITVGVSSFPGYADASPYYNLLKNDTTYTSPEIVISSTLLPGTITFFSTPVTVNIFDDPATVTYNPNLLAEPYNFVSFCIPALGVTNDRSDYYGDLFNSTILNYTSGTVSFIQDSACARYSYTPSSFTGAYSPTIVGGQTIAILGGEGGFTLLEPSFRDFNDTDPIQIAITIDTGADLAEHERVYALHGGKAEFLRKHLLGYF